MEYSEFLGNKAIKPVISGFTTSDINEQLFNFQRDIVQWALRIGRACIFADCGLGKTPMQLEWAQHVCEWTGGKVLIVAPLAVNSQTIKEGVKFGVHVENSRNGEANSPVTITNYEMFHKFDIEEFHGIVLDESSILKSYTGKFRTELIERCRNVPFKLACTATPSPNDIMELGNHAEFVGAMSRTEMLSMFFVHDGGDTQQWRLKGHAIKPFWEWVCTWAVNIRKPSDLGYNDDGFVLPDLKIHEIVANVDFCPKGALFSTGASTLQERQQARRQSVSERCNIVADISHKYDTSLIWCDRNDESATLKRMIDNAIEVKGSDTAEHKADAMIGFSEGKYKRMVTKPSIAGFGMNWQHCNKMIFTGLSDSYEQYYQAVRRCYRFGQTMPVDVYIVISSEEGAVLENIKRKDAQAKEMTNMMVECMSDITKMLIRTAPKQVYNSNNKIKIPSFLTTKGN